MFPAGVILLFQAQAFLPPQPALPVPDPAYRARVAAFAAPGRIRMADLAPLRPATPAQVAAVIDLLRRGDSQELRVAILLGTGAEPGTPLAEALFRVGCEPGDEGSTLAAVLAPRRPAPADLPALAYLASLPERPLSVRAAAVARLLEGGCAGAWPLARAILSTGTPSEETAPWADWERTGRYELPKRTLMLFVAAWLKRHGDKPPPFEPNASWRHQAEELAVLDEAATRAAAACRASRDPGLLTGIRKLREAAARKDPIAARALLLLAPHAGP
ncbi:MAG: hypothetical protein ACE5H3_03810 [Planctomycetota bacterium]